MIICTTKEYLQKHNFHGIRELTDKKGNIQGERETDLKWKMEAKNDVMATEKTGGSKY